MFVFETLFHGGEKTTERHLTLVQEQPELSHLDNSQTSCGAVISYAGK